MTNLTLLAAASAETSKTTDQLGWPMACVLISVIAGAFGVLAYVAYLGFKLEK